MVNSVVISKGLNRNQRSYRSKAVSGTVVVRKAIQNNRRLGTRTDDMPHKIFTNTVMFKSMINTEMFLLIQKQTQY